MKSKWQYICLRSNEFVRTHLINKKWKHNFFLDMENTKERILPPHNIPCRPEEPVIQRSKGFKRLRHYYDALPQDVKFAYLTAGYYATGFAILDVYKTKIDFTEERKLLFIEDPKQAHKWKTLRSRIPYPESRITDLPGIKDVNYHNYCLRSLTPESAMSWRKSIIKYESDFDDCTENIENEGT